MHIFKIETNKILLRLNKVLELLSSKSPVTPPEARTIDIELMQVSLIVENLQKRVMSAASHELSQMGEAKSMLLLSQVLDAEKRKPSRLTLEDHKALCEKHFCYIILICNLQTLTTTNLENDTNDTTNDN